LDEALTAITKNLEQLNKPRVNLIKSDSFDNNQTGDQKPITRWKDKREMRCFICNKKGHFKEECWHRDNMAARNNQNNNNRQYDNKNNRGGYKSFSRGGKGNGGNYNNGYRNNNNSRRGNYNNYNRQNRRTYNNNKSRDTSDDAKNGEASCSTEM
jgi:hypothetical protein